MTLRLSIIARCAGLSREKFCFLTYGMIVALSFLAPGPTQISQCGVAQARRTPLLRLPWLVLAACCWLSAAGPAFALQISTSVNWAGYVLTTAQQCGGSCRFNTISGTWTIPAIGRVNYPGSVGEKTSQWIGIGGATAGDQTLIQVGTTEGFDNTGAAFSYPFYELRVSTPGQITQITACTATNNPNQQVPCLVEPGDLIAGEISCDVVAGNTCTMWEIEIVNTTRNWIYDLPNIPFNSSENSAEWIVEAPLETTLNQFDSLPDFDPVTFSHPLVNLSQVSLSLAANGYDIRLPNGACSQVLGCATTSPPVENSSGHATSFAVFYGSICNSVLSRTHSFDGVNSDITFRDTSGDVAAWLMNGVLVASSAGVGNAPNSWAIVGQRDFNGDGTADLLWHDTSGNVAMWFMNGASVIGSAGVGSANPSAWSIAGTGDFNGDGKGDILWRDNSGNVAIWLMNGATVAHSCGVGNAPTTWSIAGTGDFDGDGSWDILWHDNAGNVAIWFMNGCSVVRSLGVGNANPTVWSIAGTGDFNGDGMSDILWHDTGGNVAMWMMSGAAIVQSAGVGNANPSVWSIAETGDFNSDGMSDILWHDTGGNVAMWMMSGAAIVQSAGVGNASASVWTIQGLNAD